MNRNMLPSHFGTFTCTCGNTLWEFFIRAQLLFEHIYHFSDIIKLLYNPHLCNRLQLQRPFSLKINRWMPPRFSGCLCSVWYLGFQVPIQIIWISHRLLERLIYTLVNKGMLLLQTAVVICVVSVSKVREI